MSQEVWDILAYCRSATRRAASSAARLAEQDAHCIVVGIRSHDIEIGISVKVANCNTKRSGPHGEGGLRLEAPGSCPK